MNERVMQFRVGVMVLASILIAAILIVLFGNVDVGSWFEDKKSIHVRFKSAPGVRKETPVRKNGVLIGRVTDVQIDDEGALVTINIDPLRPVRRDEICMITANLLGDATLDFFPGPQRLDAGLLEEGDTINGQLKTSPFDVIANLEGDMGEALRSMSKAGTEVSKLAGRMNTMFDENDQGLNKLLEDTSRAMVTFDKTMTSIDKIVGDERVQNDLRRTIEMMPTLLEEMQEAMESIQDTVGLASRNLENLEKFTKPLGERGEPILADMQEAVGNLNGLLGELTTFSKALNRREGTLGKFVHDPTLYNRIDRAAANIEKLTLELRPVIHNARIFTDKIARDPGELGVRGALKRSKSYK
jgi:phospholipid/cholesterol/gamma-HCH transport system substrate-binding protein